jgi:hypothetical protein
MGKGFQISFGLDAGTEQTLRLIKQWPERMQHVQAQLVYLSADYVRRFVKSRLPKSQGSRPYRASIEVARTKGLGPGQYSYTVQIDMKNRLVKQVKTHKVLLEVHPAKRSRKPDPAVLVLERFNPWTVDSLPFKPDRKLGIVIQRKATAKRVTKVTQARTKQRSKWSRELSRVGFKEIRKDTRLKISSSVSSIPDVAMDALKLEFGLGGARPRPAWRLGVRHLIRGGLRSFSRDIFVFPLTKLSSNIWSKWPTRTRHTVTTVQAKKYVNFQKKLGIHP